MSLACSGMNFLSVPSTFQLLATVLVLLACLPSAAAQQHTIPFPDVSFHDFACLVDQHFSRDASLSVVFAFLFTVIRNPEILSLHCRRRLTAGLRAGIEDVWIHVMVQRMLAEWGTNNSAFLRSNVSPAKRPDALVAAIDGLVDLLQLSTAMDDQTLPIIDETSLRHQKYLAPPRPYCVRSGCNKASLRRFGKDDDVPLVTVLEGASSHMGAWVLAGQCSRCQAVYYPDRITHTTGAVKYRQFTLAARYLKVGKNMWVDRVFGTAVLNALYSFASVTSFADFWSRTFFRGLTRRHAYQASIQASIRLVAQASDQFFIVPDGLPIRAVVAAANRELVGNKAIPIGVTHRCSDCEHDYIPPSANLRLPGVDGALTHGEDGTDDAPPATANDARRSDNDPLPEAIPILATGSKVRMKVLDGLVMGPLVRILNNLCRCLLMCCCSTVPMTWPGSLVARSSSV